MVNARTAIHSLKLLPVLLFITITGGAIDAGAALIDRGGGLIYDNALNITWLQDASLAVTSGYDNDGLMTAAEAVAWAESLVYQGYTDWRLPSARNFNGSDPVYGWNRKTNEMGHLYYVELANSATMDVFDLSGLDHTGPFLNLQAFRYWSGTPYYLSPDFWWYFNFGSGYQWDAVSTTVGYAWAVREGDSRAAVPLPGSLTLLACGILAAVGIRMANELEARKTGRSGLTNF
jgi:hypothetical protein